MGALFGLLLIAGLVNHYWAWLLAAVVIAAAYYYGLGAGA
jgi:hypothetical protein